MKVYVTGHRNPDCDSIASAIAYAEVKSRTSGYEAVPVRLGPINRETAYVLDKFGFHAPELMHNAYAQVKDVPYGKAVTVTRQTTLRDAWLLLGKERTTTLQVVDSDGKLTGVVTMGDISRAYLSASVDSSSCFFPAENLVRALGGKVLVEGEEVIKGTVLVGAMSTESAQGYIGDHELMIVGDRPDMQLLAIKSGMKAVIVTGGAFVSEEVLEAARSRGTLVISVPADTFNCAKLITQAIPVESIMTDKDIKTFSPEDFLDEVIEEMQSTRFKLFPIVDEFERPAGVIGREHLLYDARKNFILVDHNEKGQSIEGVEKARILEIIDHHRVNCVETDQPIMFINRPCGATATIVSSLARRYGIVPSKSLAGLLCAAIISDTLNFRSPTSTSEDEEEATALALRAGIDVKRLAEEMFNAGSNLEGLDPDTIVRSDFKEYRVDGAKIGVGQCMGRASKARELESALLRYIESMMEEGSYDLVALMLTDAVEDGSLVLWASRDQSLVSRAFGMERGTKSFYLPGVVSRKKQFLPPIISALRRNA